MNKLAENIIKISGSLGLLFLAFCFTGAVSVDTASATDPDDAQNFQYRNVVTKEGLSFRVPEDMPIETRNGIQAPIPFDEYMYGKFQKMDKKLQRIETKLDRIEAALNSMKEGPAKEKKPALTKTESV